MFKINISPWIALVDFYILTFVIIWYISKLVWNSTYVNGIWLKNNGLEYFFKSSSCCRSSSNFLFWKGIRASYNFIIILLYCLVLFFIFMFLYKITGLRGKSYFFFIKFIFLEESVVFRYLAAEYLHSWFKK